MEKKPKKKSKLQIKLSNQEKSMKMHEGKQKIKKENEKHEQDLLQMNAIEIEKHPLETAKIIQNLEKKIYNLEMRKNTMSIEKESINSDQILDEQNKKEKKHKSKANNIVQTPTPKKYKKHKFDSEYKPKKSNRIDFFPQGSRILNIENLFSFLNSYLYHKEKCIFSKIIFKEEMHNGLSSIFKFQCSFCKKFIDLDTSKFHEEGKTPEFNILAVLGATNNGIGFKAMESFLATLGVPAIQKGKFIEIQEFIGKKMKKNLDESMENAIENEKKLSPIEDNKSILKVMGDGA